MLSALERKPRASFSQGAAKFEDPGIKTPAKRFFRDAQAAGGSTEIDSEGGLNSRYLLRIGGPLQSRSARANFTTPKHTVSRRQSPRNSTVWVCRTRVIHSNHRGNERQCPANGSPAGNRGTPCRSSLRRNACLWTLCGPPFLSTS